MGLQLWHLLLLVCVSLSICVSSAIRWWDLWQLQFLVLACLSIQYLLAILGALRRYCIPPWIRFFTWSLFVSSDAVVAFALTALSAHASNDLQVLWAPILLVHFGGQICITAYNLEDNELWTRQILISASKVTAAVYVFCKAWSPSADNRLLLAAVLLFISGTVKCIAKVTNLRGSSFKSLSTTVNDVRRTRGQLRLEDFVEEARGFIEAAAGGFFQQYRAGGSPTESLTIPFHSPEKLCVDFAHSYDDLLDNIISFCSRDHDTVYRAIRWGLADTFELLYTKTHAPRMIYKNLRSVLTSTFELLKTRTRAPRTANSLLEPQTASSQPEPHTANAQLEPISYPFLVTWALVVGLLTLAIGLFHSIDKQAYKGIDFTVTLLLLYGTLGLELISVHLAVRSGREWTDMVAQHNLFGYFAHSKRHSKVMSFAGRLHCKDLLDQYWCMDPCGLEAAVGITGVIRTHIQLMWLDFIQDAQDYTEITNIRGQWMLSHMNCDFFVGSSIEKPFDESVLLWHIATDFCFHLSTSAGANRCRQMSNYMLHLLFANPEMLLPGSRKSLFTEAYNELSDILGGEEGRYDVAEKLVQKIIYSLEAGEVPEGSIIHDAWLIAEELRAMDADSMAIVIQGVWVEMLCFSAGRCRGNLHAKSLGTGGEYLSVVSLLLVYSGMQTLPDRLQAAPFGYSSSSASGSGGEGSTSASASGSEGEGTTAASPSGPGGEGTTSEYVQIVVVPSNSGSEGITPDLDEMAALASTSGSEGAASELDQIVVAP